MNVVILEWAFFAFGFVWDGWLAFVTCSVDCGGSDVFCLVLLDAGVISSVRVGGIDTPRYPT